MFLNRIFVFAIILLVMLTNCGNEDEKKLNSKTYDSLGIESTEIIDSIKPILFTQYLLDKSGNVIDSFQHNSSWIKYLNIGKMQPFPNGFASLQQSLNDTIHRVCELECELCELFYMSDDGDTNKCLKTGNFIEQFKPTDGESYFNSIDYLNYYFFLAQVDSCFISMEDTEYGLLNFMKLKTARYKLEHTVKVMKEEWVNICDNEYVTWKKPISVFMIEKNKTHETNFNQWQEIWECGEKADYAPKYPLVDIKQVKGIFKSYQEIGSPMNALQDPYFIFSYILMDESKNELKNIETKAYPLQLVTVKGEIRKGKGIDINNDKHADVFWYDRIYMKGYPVEKRNTVLYLKLNKNWTPVYINNFSVFY